MNFRECSRETDRETETDRQVDRQTEREILCSLLLFKRLAVHIILCLINMETPRIFADCGFVA